MHNLNTPTNGPKGAKQKGKAVQLVYHSSGLEVIKRDEGNKGKRRLSLLICNFKVPDLSSWGLLGLSSFLRSVGQNRWKTKQTKQRWCSYGRELSTLWGSMGANQWSLNFLLQSSLALSYSPSPVCGFLGCLTFSICWDVTLRSGLCGCLWFLLKRWKPQHMTSYECRFIQSEGLTSPNRKIPYVCGAAIHML